MIEAMVPAPFGFLEVEVEELVANAPQLDEAELSIAPEALDPVDVIFSASELIFMVMNAMVFVTAQDEAVVSLPPIGIEGGFGKHLALDEKAPVLPWSSFAPRW